MDECEIEDLLGRGRSMQALLRQIRLMGQVEAPLLVEGEPGVGKLAVMRAVHRFSGRAAGPFALLRGGEISPALFASELCGLVEGAFGGALAPHEGAAAAAEGGSLVIDGIDELTPESREIVFRLVERGEVVPVGGTPRRVDVRLLCSAAATAPPPRLEDPLAARLRAFVLRVPALRHRLEDLPVLAWDFARRAARRYAKEICGLSPEALALLRAQRWEGNLRQLAIEMERAVVLTPAGGVIEPEVFSPRLVAPRSGA